MIGQLELPQQICTQLLSFHLLALYIGNSFQVVDFEMEKTLLSGIARNRKADPGAVFVFAGRRARGSFSGERLAKVGQSTRKIRVRAWASSYGLALVR